VAEAQRIRADVDGADTNVFILFIAHPHVEHARQPCEIDKDFMRNVRIVPAERMKRRDVPN
jgi:hypothetical protein